MSARSSTKRESPPIRRIVSVEVASSRASGRRACLTTPLAAPVRLALVLVFAFGLAAGRVLVEVFTAAVGARWAAGGVVCTTTTGAGGGAGAG